MQGNRVVEKSLQTRAHNQLRRVPDLEEGGATSLERLVDSFFYWRPIIKMENEPGTIGPRAGRPAGPGGAFAGAGAYSAAMVRT
jgi:hypothetical protein